MCFDIHSRSFGRLSSQSITAKYFECARCSLDLTFSSPTLGLSSGYSAASLGHIAFPIANSYLVKS